MLEKNANFVHKFFEIGILLKGLNGLLELIGGVLLFFVNPQTVNKVVVLLTQSELSEDPKDFVANFFVLSAHGFTSGTQLFGSLFLLSHGLIKLFLIIALFKRKLWAYPLAIGVFGLFIAYQMYRYALSPSFWLIFLSVLDAAVILLTYLEYRNLKSEQSIS